MRFSDNPKMKKLLGRAVAVLALIAVVCTCPFPVRVNTTMAGYYVDAQRQSAEPVEVDVTGWYLRYLFFKDDLRVEFDLPDPTKKYVKSMETISVPGFDGSLTWCSYYQSDENRMSSGSMFADKAFEKCVLTFLDEDYYVLSSDTNADLNTFCQSVWLHLSKTQPPLILEN